jgi:hypothetical protein
MPEEYEITIKGHLNDAWAVYFPGLTLLRLESGETLLSGCLPDQSALHGALERIRDLNLTLITVKRNPLSETNHPSLEEK